MSTTELDEGESLALLASAPVARLIVSVSDVIDVFPITHTVIEGDVYFRTAPGEKLAGLAVNASVIIEADEFSASSSWSVVVRGLAHRMEDADESAEILPRLRDPFAGGWKEVVVRVVPSNVSGRRLERAPVDDAPALDPPD